MGNDSLNLSYTITSKRGITTTEALLYKPADYQIALQYMVASVAEADST